MHSSDLMMLLAGAAQVALGRPVVGYLLLCTVFVVVRLEKK